MQSSRMADPLCKEDLFIQASRNVNILNHEQKIDLLFWSLKGPLAYHLHCWILVISYEI